MPISLEGAEAQKGPRSPKSVMHVIPERIPESVLTARHRLFASTLLASVNNR
jgi:hypothetical protein